MNKRKRKTSNSNMIPVEKYINPYDRNVIWYYIPGFNGYEICNFGIVRSMKHFKKYPFGILIKPKEINDVVELFVKPFGDLTYELSDNNNKRQIVKASKLKYLAATNPYTVRGYPRPTMVTDIGSRNKRCFVQRQVVAQEPIIDESILLQNYHKDDNIIKPLIFERTEDNV